MDVPCLGVDLCKWIPPRTRRGRRDPQQCIKITELTGISDVTDAEILSRLEYQGERTFYLLRRAQ
jgi:hypothetical protein